jgi:PIN domain nuclease of toxin-antitoxin system
VSLLVDTNVLIWLLAGSARLRHEIIDILSDARNDVYVSTVSVWEMAINTTLA